MEQQDRKEIERKWMCQWEAVFKILNKEDCYFLWDSYGGNGLTGKVTELQNLGNLVQEKSNSS